MPDSMVKGALSEPATQQAWKKSQRRATSALVVWILTLPGFYVVATIVWEALWGSLPQYVIPLLVAASLIGIVVSQTRRERVKRMRRVLEIYPWQSHTQVAHATQNGSTHLRLPDPDNQEKGVTVPLRPSDNRRWRRVAPENPAREFWFAGDPRFAGVVALPGPRTLTLIEQRNALGREKHNPPRGVSAQAWDRAWAARSND